MVDRWLALSLGNTDVKCFGLEMDQDTSLKCKFLVTWGLDSVIDYLAPESLVGHTRSRKDASAKLQT